MAAVASESMSIWAVATVEGRGTRSGRTQHAQDAADHPVELGPFGGELPPPGRGQRVVAGAAVVLRNAPRRRRPAVDEDPLESGVERALTDLQDVVRRQPQVLDDAIAVLRPVRERLQ